MALYKEGKYEIEIYKFVLQNTMDFQALCTYIFCVIEAIHFIRQLYFNLNTGNQQLYLSKQI